MSGQERAVLGVIGTVIILLFVLLFWPRSDTPANVVSAPTAQTQVPEVAPPPPTQDPRPEPRERARPVVSEEPPPPPPADSNAGEPPPLSGLILTFPSDMSEEEIDAELAKCRATVVRRRNNFVKVKPAGKSSYDTIKRCFEHGAVTVQEERMPAPTP